jgi:integrase/recombinase XerC
MSATVFKKGRVYHFRFQVGKARVQRSTRMTSKTKAEDIAAREYNAAVVRANGGEPVPTLAELAGAWVVVHRPVASSAHIRSVETFRRLHMYDLAGKPIGDITTKDVELARVEHLQTHAPSSANHWLRILKLLTMWAVKREILASSPWRVKMLKVQKKPRPFLPVDVVRTWFDAIDAATQRAPGKATAVRLMFGLGLREGETLSARWEWFDWERLTYTPGITKGREAEPVPMARWLCDYLAPMRQVEGLVVAKASGEAFRAGFTRQVLRQANTACSIKGITPHRLRGTFATLLSEEGVPIQTIQRVMRHKSHATTMGYLEKNLDTAARAADVIGAKVGFGGAKVARSMEESP